MTPRIPTGALAWRCLLPLHRWAISEDSSSRHPIPFSLLRQTLVVRQGRIAPFIPLDITKSTPNRGKVMHVRGSDGSVNDDQMSWIGALSDAGFLD